MIWYLEINMFKNMKRIFLLLVLFSLFVFFGCTGPPGPQGPPGVQGRDGQNIQSEVFELRNVNFGLNNNDEYTIYQTLNPNIYDSDVVLVYRMSGTIDSDTPIWQLLPRTLFLQPGELDYDFDFTKEDFTIYAGGTYNLALTPEYITNQTFRIVIIPGYFSNGRKTVDLNNYNEVVRIYNIDDTHVKVLN